MQCSEIYEQLILNSYLLKKNDMNPMVQFTCNPLQHTSNRMIQNI